MPSTAWVLDNRYELIRPVTGGGQAALWEGRDRRTNQRVAAKMFYPEQDRYVERERELFSALRDHHPNVVSLLGTGTHNGGVYHVMSWIEGASLAQVLERNAKPYLVQALGWAQQIASALAWIHRHDIIHRDVKPGNLMITTTQPQRVVLIDFSISRFTHGTVTLGPPGTPNYAAPEIWTSRRGDHRIDLYSLGCVLYEMLTGDPPFRGSEETARHHHLRVIPPAPRKCVSSIPQRLDDLTMNLLAKHPADRPANADVVVTELTSIIEEIARRVDVPDAQQLTEDLGADAPGSLEDRLRRAELIAATGDVPGGARECESVIKECVRQLGPAHELTMKARATRFTIIARYSGQDR
ncbi:serine/threonine protein kinase [Nonomuraea jiangxiensis]|uniref:Serine/threonine protein kinase n=1 Tax=Nonomuraea jiangxiensis TaxID=633440 RepID=A0A1G9F1G0_9ACTN|nr:serine/threonine-protein kinase [Nonomuraea jiangxiensis]SDK82103.1 serine/threonine protein kinase [Nonomuraea jiangxiensis]